MIEFLSLRYCHANSVSLSEISFFDESGVYVPVNTYTVAAPYSPTKEQIEKAFDRDIGKLCI